LDSKPRSGSCKWRSQKANCSVRADVFGFASKLRHHVMRSELRICANRRRRPPHFNRSLIRKSCCQVTTPGGQLRDLMQTLCGVAETRHFTTEMFKVHPQSRSRNVLRLASQDRDANDGANFRRFVGLRISPSATVRARVPRRACGGWRSPTTETDPARVTGHRHLPQQRLPHGRSANAGYKNGILGKMFLGRPHRGGALALLYDDVVIRPAILALTHF
jgi:hypothetical protein